LTFKPLGYDTTVLPNAWKLQPAITIPLEMKAMHDEMGGVYDTMYGRMSGMLGLTNPTSPVHVLIPYGFSSPPTDLVKGALETAQIGVLADGTQIWRIFHNGVDTHPIHTHLFTAQLINRVGQDGQVIGGGVAVDPTDLGWKDTFKVNPLEVTFLALRPTVPTPSQLPFEVPDSVRLIDPTLPEGATLPPPAPAGWFDPNGNPIAEILNHTVNFGWEYVWHCHILSHEEMDFMHSLVFAAPPMPPTELTATPPATGSKPNLNWIDNSIREVKFRIERATNDTFTTGLTTFEYVNPVTTAPNAVAIQDQNAITAGIRYWYRVFAVGETVGDVLIPGFPTMVAESVSNTPAPVLIGTPPGAPTSPTGMNALVQANPAGGPQVRLRWTDNANNETSFALERCTGAGCGTIDTNFTQVATVPPRTTGSATVTYFDTTVTPGNIYNYRVWAVNSAGRSADPSPLATAPVVFADVPAVPAAPTDFRAVNATAAVSGPNTTVTLSWTHPGGANLNGFTIQFATNATFTTGLTTVSRTALDRGPYPQTVKDNTTYYFRIRANNTISGSSAWTNALPFPIRTGK